MAGLHIHFRDMEKVIDRLEDTGTPFYMVYEGKQLVFISPVKDADNTPEQMSEAIEFLRNNLTAIKEGGSTASYRIEYYRTVTGEGRYRKDDLIGSNTFKLNDIEDSGGAWLDRKTFAGPNYVREVIERNSALESELNSLKLQKELEEQEDEQQGSALSGLLSGFMPILERPEVQQAIAGRVINFLDSILPQKKNSMGNNVMVNDVYSEVSPKPLSENETNRLIECVNQLLSAGVTLQDFEKLVVISNDKNRFSGFLNMLRLL